MTTNLVRIGTRPKRGQSYSTWRTMWAVIFDQMYPFTTAGSLRGYPVEDDGPTPLPYGHRLSGDDLARWRADDLTIAYVVTSYDTPIAWMTCEPFHDPVWYFVKDKFSVTTSKHQSLIRTMTTDI